MEYTIFFTVTFLLYLASTVLYPIAVIFKSERIGGYARLTTLFGFISHTVALILRGLASGHHPIANLYESMSFFAWTIILIYLVLDHKYRLMVLGAFVIPLSFLVVALTSLLPGKIKPLLPALDSYWLGFHTTFSFLAYAAFAIAFVSGLMYLIQERQLKSKRLGGFYSRLPSLETIDSLGYKSIALGFPLLTLGILTGAIWAQSAWGRYWGWDPKETWALITWLVYAAYLLIRRTAGWQGKKAAYLSIIGFLGVVFTYLGLNLLAKGLHVY